MALLPHGAGKREIGQKQERTGVTALEVEREAAQCQVQHGKDAAHAVHVEGVGRRHARLHAEDEKREGREDWHRGTFLMVRSPTLWWPIQYIHVMSSEIGTAMVRATQSVRESGM